MNVAVVGGTGVLGRALVPLLEAAGISVRVLARRAPEPGRLDLLGERDAARLRQLLEGCDVVVHAATAIPRDPTAPGAWDLTARLRTQGTRRLLDAAIQAGVKRYVQQSIALAYADGGDEWIGEGAPFDDSPARAQVVRPVREMEAMVCAAPIGWCILRGGAFVGPGTAQERTIERLRQGAEKIIAGGAHFLPLVHVADAARAFALAIEKPLNGEVLNVAGTPIRQRDYLKALAARIGVRAPAEAPGPRPSSLRVSSEQARRIIGWQPLSASDSCPGTPWSVSTPARPPSGCT